MFKPLKSDSVSIFCSFNGQSYGERYWDRRTIIKNVTNQWCQDITKTRVYNFDPLKLHFYIVKLGFTGVYIIFHISAQNIFIEAICFMSYFVSFCSCVFSVLLALRLPRLEKRKLILLLFVPLFDLCLFGFVGFLFLLVSGKGCGLWLWQSLDFSLTFFIDCGYL